MHVLVQPVRKLPSAAVTERLGVHVLGPHAKPEIVADQPQGNAGQLEAAACRGVADIETGPEPLPDTRRTQKQRGEKQRGKSGQGPWPPEEEDHRNTGDGPQPGIAGERKTQGAAQQKPENRNPPALSPAEHQAIRSQRHQHQHLQAGVGHPVAHETGNPVQQVPVRIRDKLRQARHRGDRCEDKHRVIDPDRPRPAASEQGNQKQYKEDEEFLHDGQAQKRIRRGERRQHRPQEEAKHGPGNAWPHWKNLIPPGKDPQGAGERPGQQ